MSTDRTSEELSKLIKRLECSLLEQSVRNSQNQLNQLIADDFVEFGASGAVYNKQNILESLPSEKTRTFDMIDFEVKKLSQHIILALYKTIENGVVSLRSSIWKQYGNEWQVFFHQGTKVPETYDEHKK